jgi:ferrochelatase
MGKKAVLLVNLGSPDSPSVSDVRRYLREFLMDKYVINKNFLLRFFLVNFIIIPFRVKNSAHAYASIWQKDGSPLIIISKLFFEKFKKKSQYSVALGMRYGSMSIKKAVQILVHENPDLETIQLLPLYPHYAMASTKTVIEKTKEILKDYPGITLRAVESFYDNSAYIQCICNSIKTSVDLAKIDHVLFSYHGIPESHIYQSDITKQHCLKNKECCLTKSDAHRFCYRHQVTVTTELVAKELSLPKDLYSQSYQSRLGREPWLSPFTDYTIVELAKSGVKHLAVLCPAFVADCLETIEEIGMEAKEEFLENGGETFTLIPCLNDTDDWVNAAVSLLEGAKELD